MKKSLKLALVIVCGLMLIISAGCGSKKVDNQDHSNMPEMDHSKMQMDDKAKK